MEYKSEEELEHCKKCERYSIPEGLSLSKACDEFEKQFLMKSLSDNYWNQSKTAKQLGVHRNTLVNRIKHLNISQLIKPAKEEIYSKKRWVK